MISAVIDTNILVRGTIASHPRSASKQVIDALFADLFMLILSPAAIDEIQRVLSDPSIRAKHGRSVEEIMDFCWTLQLKSRMLEPWTEIKSSLTRDTTDTKWVALALDSRADYLVTADRRHLLRLRQIGETKVIGPRAFLEVIS